MKHVRRYPALALGVAALVVVAHRSSAQRGAPPPQRGSPPGAETPYILVTAFHAPTKLLAVEAADELRSRLASEHSAKDLFVITKATVEATLKASGYPVDSALSVADLMELGRTLRGEYVIDGTAKKGAGNAVRFELNMLIRTGQTTLTQPLPAIDGKDVGDAARLGDHAITEALKQMVGYRACIAALRAGKNDVAATQARLGMAAYASSAFSRICLLNAFVSANAPPDSIAVAANQVLAADSTNMFALGSLASAYKAMKDKRETDVYTRIYALDPTNPTTVRALIDIFMTSAPEKALQMIDPLLKELPGDTALLKRKWVAHGRLKQFKEAMKAGDEYVKADPSALTAEFFKGQIGAAQSDSNSAKVLEYAEAGSKRFPKEESFPLLLAQTYYRAGKLPEALNAARRVTVANPKSYDAWNFIIAVFNDQHQTDSVMSAGQAAIAAGVKKDSVGDLLLARVVGPSLRAAQASKARTDWEAALKAAQAVDAISSSAQSNFYIGVSAFQIASDILTGDLQTLVKSKKKEDQALACTQAKQAEDYLATTQIAMPRGGSVDANVAKQILTGVASYGEFIGSVKKAFCK
jgi:tetratricopeptide (TPR) repeat protein